MVYPKFKNKHVEVALFSPEDFVYSYKKWPQTLPKKYILIYQQSALNYFVKKYKVKKVKLDHYVTIAIYKDIGLIKIPGVGSPQAATLLEELIALGGKQFINIGTAGGLHHEGLFLCNKALRDEGTSYHYLPHGRFSYPDKGLTKKLGKALAAKKLEYFEGTTWTIDAPYRETRAEIERYAKKGILTVEMEASALFAVAQYRKVKIASAFTVSDILRKRWEPYFHKLNVKKLLNLLIDAAVDCLNR